MFSPTTLQMTNRPSASILTKYTINIYTFIFYYNYKNKQHRIIINYNTNHISNKLSNVIKSLWWLFLQHHRNFLNFSQKQIQHHTITTQQQNHKIFIQIIDNLNFRLTSSLKFLNDFSSFVKSNNSWTMNKRTVIIIALVSVLCLGIGGNFYFMYYLNNAETPLSSTRALENVIRSKIRHLKPAYLNRNPRFFMYRNKLLKNYKPASYENASVLWDIANWWPHENEIYPQYDSSMSQLLQTLRLEPITKVYNLGKGTQLKLLVRLSNQQKVIFKPQWYPRDIVIEGPVYGGKDRHVAEVYAFYLGAVLDFRWTPIVVGRVVNLKTEIYEKGDTELQNTMTITEDDNGTEQYCLFGKCHYCNEEETVCADENNNIEGVLIYIIPGQLAKRRSPWQRTYKEDKRAPWEDDMNYCKGLKGKMETERLLDLIDVSIFDYLIQNGDRHHYETREERVVLIDNGKAFGNPNKDHLDILAPLYQCCLLRASTWERLQVFSGGVLTELVDRLTKADALYPLLTDKHKRGVERRLVVVYAVVEYCMDREGEKMFKNL